MAGSRHLIERRLTAYNAGRRAALGRGPGCSPGLCRPAPALISASAQAALAIDNTFLEEQRHEIASVLRRRVAVAVVGVRRARSSRRLVFDVYHPRHAKAVHQHAESRGPEGRCKWHLHFPAGGQGLKSTLALGDIAGGDAQADAMDA